MTEELRPTSRRCGVLGSPIAHSLSPVLHHAAYAHLRLDWQYDAHDVDEATLPAFLDGLDRSWRGLSLTMPLKQAALACCDEASELARQVVAVNTVLIEEDGRRRADNTDVPGMVAAMSEHGIVRVPEASVLGGGATARSAIAALGRVTDRITAYVRTPARADDLLGTASGVGVTCTVRPWSERTDGLGAPVVVSTTPLGAVDDLAREVPARPGALLDVVYDPWPTPLAAAWATAGGVLVSGLDLLVHQAVLQVVLMTGRECPVEVLRAAGEDTLAARSAMRLQR